MIKMFPSRLNQGSTLNHETDLSTGWGRKRNLKKGLEILIAVVFCKECVLPVQGWFLFCKGGRMGGELTEGVGEQKPTLHDQNTTSNPALKTTSTQAFQEISSPFKHSSMEYFTFSLLGSLVGHK